jgi:hypothetical protein
MGSYVLNLVSLAIALTAVGVAIWQARATAQRTERALSLPVLAEISSEVRSPEFHESLIFLLTGSPPAVPSDGGFEALPEGFRKNAYRVCYFFDYLGVLATYGIVADKTAVDWVGTRLMQVWLVMKPYIEAEREFRKRTLPPATPTGFLSHFERLAKILGEEHDSGADTKSAVRNWT